MVAITAVVASCEGDDGAVTPDAATVVLPDAAIDAPPPREIYAGKVDNQSSVWASLGSIGLAAGHDMCRTMVATADHVCDYTEVRAAEAAGQLAGIPAATTAWIQRTTTEMVSGQASPPGAGRQLRRLELQRHPRRRR